MVGMARRRRPALVGILHGFSPLRRRRSRGLRQMPTGDARSRGPGQTRPGNARPAIRPLRTPSDRAGDATASWRRPRARFSWFLGDARRVGHAELLADRADDGGSQLAGPRGRGAWPACGRRPPRVVRALAVEPAALLWQMSLQIAALHAAIVSSSGAVRAPGGTSTVPPASLST